MLKEVSKWGYRISALFWSRDVRGSSVWGTQLWKAPAPGMKSLLLREAFEGLGFALAPLFSIPPPPIRRTWSFSDTTHRRSLSPTPLSGLHTCARAVSSA